MSQPAEREPFYEYRRVEARRLLYRLQNELEFKLFLKETVEKNVINCDELDFLDPTGDIKLSKLKKTIQEKQQVEGHNRYPKRTITKINYSEVKEPDNDEYRYLLGRAFVNKADHNDLRKKSMKVDKLPSSEIRRDPGFEAHQLESREFKDLILADCSEEGSCGPMAEDKEKPHRCSQCSKSFRRKAHLRQHTRIHTGEKPFECSVCGMKFNQVGSRNAHMRIHTGEKPYQCSVCRMKFHQSNGRNYHMTIHAGEKPFGCLVCGVKFSSSSTRIQHMRIHTGENPYVCSVCGMTFSQSSHRNRHVRIHTGDKPYASSVCGMKFNQSSSRDRHMTIRSGEKPLNASRVP